VTATAAATGSATASPTASAIQPGQAQPTATAPVAPPPPAIPVFPQIFRVLPRPSQGHGVTVAVVDSGLDYSPQLAGRVSAIDLTG
jgi:hypothetical protein